MIELNNGNLRLRLDPEIGGSIVDFSAKLGDRWIPIMRRGEEPLTKSSNASSFVLIPYSNRLRDGRFSFGGKSYQLRHAEKHAIHGDVRDRPLRVLEGSEDRVVLEFKSDEVSDLNFPFRFSARMIYALEGFELSCRIELVNVGTESMPAGCGFHPYFNRRLPGSTGEVELQIKVSGVYPGETPLPTGPAIPIAPQQDFSTQRPLDVVLDHCFAGWDRQALIEWPGSSVKARIQAEQGMEHVILFSPEGQEVFALEPVTNANDGFNLLVQGDKNCGVVVLKPGDALKTGFTILIEE
jgi:aldose 1-epimerase